MLVAIISARHAASGQIGDGAICLRLRGTETFDYVFWPEKGDYAKVTFFVTDANPEQHLEFDETNGERVDLAVFSDWLALDFAERETHSAFLSGLLPVCLSAFAGVHQRWDTALEKPPQSRTIRTLSSARPSGINLFSNSARMIAGLLGFTPTFFIPSGAKPRNKTVNVLRAL